MIVMLNTAYACWQGLHRGYYLPSRKPEESSKPAAVRAGTWLLKQEALQADCRRQDAELSDRIAHPPVPGCDRRLA